MNEVIVDIPRRFQDIDDVSVDWEQLANDVNAPPFLRPGWMRAWQQAFTSTGLTVYTVWRGDRLAALAPMRVVRRSVESATNVHTPLWNILAVDDQAASSLMHEVLSDRPHQVTFEWLDIGSSTARTAVQTIEKFGYKPMVHDVMRSPYSRVALPWEEFEQRLSKRRRSQLRRYGRRLDDEGTVTFETRDGTVDLDASLDEGYLVESSGWKGREGTAIASRADTRSFYTSVARWAAERGWLKLAYLRSDRRAIAFEYLLDCDGTMYYIKAGYDETHSKWSPSTLLAKHTLQDAVASNTEFFEWLGHDDSYKLEWSDGVHERLKATWFAPTLRGRVARLTRSASSRAAAEVRPIVFALLPEPTVKRLKEFRARLKATDVLRRRSS